MFSNISSIYRRVFDTLDLGEDKVTQRQALVLVLVAYLFGVFCRIFYLWNALDIPSMLINGLPMISAEDGYLFADNVQRVLAPDPNRSTIDLWQTGAEGALTAITLFLVRITPFTIEQVAVFMPMIFAPLVAVPIFYAGRFLGSSAMGFCAALLSVISLSYLKRTSFAYYDTDLFSLIAPAMIVALGIYAIKNPGLLQILWVGTMLALAKWLDKPQIAELMYIAFIGGYILTNWRHPQIYSHILLLCMTLVAGIKWHNHLVWNAAVFAALYAIERYAPPLNRRVWQGLAAVAVIYTFMQSSLYYSIVYYINLYGSAGRGVSADSFAAQGWNFYQVSGTIAEARKIGLLGLAREVSGPIYLFWLGILGAILAVLRYPPLAIGGFFLGVGLFALEGGIRFSLYLTPILAIGSAYLALLLARYLCLSEYLSRVKYSQFAVAAALVAVMIYPSLSSAYNYNPRSVLQLPQVEILQRLGEKAQSTDYIISWWDYGYVMSFYSKMRNIVHGGKHQNDNYVVSKAFSSTSPRLAANLIRENIEAYEASGGTANTSISQVLGPRRAGFNPDEFINSMASPDYQLQRNKTRDIYFYMPYQMLAIYDVVRDFSDLSLNSGKQQKAPLIATMGYSIDRENQRLILADGTIIDVPQGVIIQQGEAIGRVNTIYNHRVGQNGQSEMIPTIINGLGYYYVILAGYYDIAYVMSPEAFRANFIQMFFFNNYDKELFELVERNPYATLYKLKR